MAVEHLDTSFAFRPIGRAAMLVFHSNPLREPGAGDAGGMTVYVREMARALAKRGIEVDIFTRRDNDADAETQIFDGVRVVPVEAGAPDLPKEQLAAHLPEFAAKIQAWAARNHRVYDVIHSHYWLSGKAASVLKRSWNVPFVHTFHTLGRVKNAALRDGDLPEPDGRLLGEAKVIADACAIVASTHDERRSLLELYAAHPERIHTIPPGVDHDLFSPGDRTQARARLQLNTPQVLLFVGRLQPLKAADTAIRAFSSLIGLGHLRRGEATLVVVGGPSGPNGAGEPARLTALSIELGIADDVRFVPAQPQENLLHYYRAADVCLVPSHAESFGLVALEAQACGVPVVASRVGGLRTIVQDGATGFLVDPSCATCFANKSWRLLSDNGLREQMGALAAARSCQFSWDESASHLHELYSSETVEECASVAREETY